MKSPPSTQTRDQTQSPRTEPAPNLFQNLPDAVRGILPMIEGPGHGFEFHMPDGSIYEFSRKK